MGSSQKVTGYHIFEFPLMVDGGLAARITCSCRYIANIDRIGPPEILQLSEVTAQVLRQGERPEHRWVDVPFYLDSMVRTYLRSPDGGKPALLEHAKNEGVALFGGNT